jgi:PTH1 family peptidyl-tRNA hydrolase
MGSNRITEMLRLLVFLGNPGSTYERTRHNIAWRLLPRLTFRSELVWRGKFKGHFARHECGDRTVYLLKPLGFMNRSGESAQALMRFFKIDPSQMLVIHDEVEIEFGRWSFKRGGGTAGHNGIRSLVSALGTGEFERLRLGISRPIRGEVSSYVLGRFTEAEEAELPAFLDAAAAALQAHIAC